jgi:hypothetical protein
MKGLLCFISCKDKYEAFFLNLFKGYFIIQISRSNLNRSLGFLMFCAFSL